MMPEPLVNLADAFILFGDLVVGTIILGAIFVYLRSLK